MVPSDVGHGLFPDVSGKSNDWQENEIETESFALRMGEENNRMMVGSQLFDLRQTLIGWPCKLFSLRIQYRLLFFFFYYCWCWFWNHSLRSFDIRMSAHSIVIISADYLMGVRSDLWILNPESRTEYYHNILSILNKIMHNNNKYECECEQPSSLCCYRIIIKKNADNPLP